MHASFANLTVDDENISILSFKESDVVGIKVELKNFGEPAYATEISIKFDERLDFIRKDDIVSIYILLTLKLQMYQLVYNYKFLRLIK